MPTLIPQATRIAAAGNKPKTIEEFIGRVNSKHDELSVARMTSPAGWVEPGQRPEFLEVSVVLSGRLHVEHEGGAFDVSSGPGRRLQSRRMGALQHTRRRCSTSPFACRRFRQARCIAMMTKARCPLSSDRAGIREGGTRTVREARETRCCCLHALVLNRSREL